MNNEFECMKHNMIIIIINIMLGYSRTTKVVHEFDID